METLGIIVAGLLIIVMSLACLFGSYFLPFFIALVRRRADKWKILAINFFLGWLAPGWAWAFVMSVWDENVVPLWRK